MFKQYLTFSVVTLETTRDKKKIKELMPTKINSTQVQSDNQFELKMSS